MNGTCQINLFTYDNVAVIWMFALISAENVDSVDLVGDGCGQTLL